MSGKKPILPKTPVPIPEPEKKVVEEETALRNIRKRDRNAGAGLHKTTIEIPMEYYELIEQELTDNYETFKGFIMRLVKKHFDDKNR